MGSAGFNSFNPFPDDPVPLGTSYQGGFYAGKVTKADGIYAIIVSPKASGESGGATIKYKTIDDTTSGTQSLVQGLENSNSMNTSAHPAAWYCNNLSINGYTDWYLPARDELEVLYRNLKPGTTANYTTANRVNSAIVYTPLDDLVVTPGTNRYSVPVGAAYTSGSPAQTSVLAFRTGGAEAFIENRYWSSSEFSSTNAWGQTFDTGAQYSLNKTSSYNVRAVRSIKLT